jgi:hypothetical protein
MANHEVESLSLRVGDLTFALTSGDPSLKLEAQGAAKHFVVAGGKPDVRMSVAWGDSLEPANGEKLFEAGTLWSLYRQDGGYLFRFTAPCFGPLPYKTALFSGDFTSGELSLHAACFRRDEPVYPLEYPLDELLMVNLLALGRGIEVHACGVRDSDGRGYLFLGQSGAGKTTMARLWPPSAQILSDDRIILRFLDGRLWMYGTPWHGEAELACSARTPLTRVFFLQKGGRNEAVPLAQAATVARFVACSFIPFHSRTGVDFALGFLQQASQAVPCLELRFAPDEHVVDFVRRTAEANA